MKTLDQISLRNILNNLDVIILTHSDPEPKLPHLDWLKKTNPDCNIHIVVGEDSPKGKFYNWKNGDIPLRNWYRLNSHLVKSDTVAVIEWDTLVGCEIPKLQDGLDLASKKVFRENLNNRGKWIPKSMKDKMWTPDNWYWWNEIPHLNLKENQVATGLISFGFFLMRKWILDELIKPEWDDVYNKSIQNELRFPTIANNVGAKVGEIDLPFVWYESVGLTKEIGIYHSIKNPVPLTYWD